MSRTIRIIFSVLLVIGIALQARSILEKKIYYVNTDNKVGEARFWSIYLGQYDVKLQRQIAGEGTQPVSGSVNIQLLSSGYLEGNGYGTKGKITSLPDMMIRTESGEKKIVLDSVEYLYDFGQKVKMITGEKGEFIIDIEGTKVSPKKFVLREFKLENFEGEEVLKGEATETNIQAFGFKKETAQKILSGGTGK